MIRNCNKRECVYFYTDCALMTSDRKCIQHTDELYEYCESYVQRYNHWGDNVIYAGVGSEVYKLESNVPKYIIDISTLPYHYDSRVLQSWDTINIDIPTLIVLNHKNLLRRPISFKYRRN